METLILESFIPDAASFDRWIDLTDAYASAFLRLQAGDESVRPEMRELGRALQRINHSVYDQTRDAQGPAVEQAAS